MPTVVIASPKGGAGKSTAAVLLGTELAQAGASVVMLDCDPNQSLTLWAARAPLPARVNVLSSITESDIVKTIKAHDTDGQIVIVDLEGVASRLVSRAISQADLVITPMRATTLDATIGVRALQLIAEEEEALDRKIPHSVVFTMTKAVRSKQHSGIAESLAAQGWTSSIRRSWSVQHSLLSSSSVGTCGVCLRKGTWMELSKMQPCLPRRSTNGWRRESEMSDGKAFNIDLGRLKSREKDRSPQAIEKAERAGEDLGFVARDGQKRRGRKPSPRTGQVHAKVMPGISEEIANEAKRRGVQQGVLIEEAWALYKAKSGI